LFHSFGSNGPKICNLERLSSLEINLARLDKDSSVKPTSMEIVIEMGDVAKED
jgi:hypothetical protein